MILDVHKYGQEELSVGVCCPICFENDWNYKPYEQDPSFSYKDSYVCNACGFEVTSKNFKEFSE